MEFKADEQGTVNALEYIIPILERLKLRWCITGGFACYVYGVQRPITDIDIDVEGSKDDAAFQKLLKEVEPHITQSLEHFVDQNYDNYNFEITIDGQVIDICPMKEMGVFDKSKGKYECFYRDGFPRIETIDFHGLRLPLLAKELIIKNKEMLMWQRESDVKDVAGLRASMQK
ncbi:MAG: hypothetical protein EXS51_02685 [Candidatus Taylorbacteria bacterium]|nr:hypothetical protein [Candidatus Taylorbacteria bacterium]